MQQSVGPGDIPARPLTVAVAAAGFPEVMAAVAAAAAAGAVRAILVGDSAAIAREAASAGLDLGSHLVVEASGQAVAAEAVRPVAAGEADLLLKGRIPTAELLRAVLERRHGLRGEGPLSHVAVLTLPTWPRPLLLTDGAVNIAPDLERKAALIDNAVAVAAALGITQPRVAALAAIEKVNPAMPSSAEAALLSKMAERGQIKGCLVDGPLALDVAISPEAARLKGVGGAVAGQADILLAPNIEVANTLYKALVYLGGARPAGVVVGARAPIAMASRADSAETRLAGILLAVRLVGRAAAGAPAAPPPLTATSGQPPAPPLQPGDRMQDLAWDGRVC